VGLIPAPGRRKPPAASPYPLPPAPPRRGPSPVIQIIVYGCVAAIAVVGGFWGVSALRQACGGTHSGVRKIDGECIGATDGAVVYREEYRKVEGDIQAENAGTAGRPAVTIGVLNPFTGPKTAVPNAAELNHQLEGMFTAVHQYNLSLTDDSQVHLRLSLVNEGAAETQWKKATQQLSAMVDDPAPLVAVVGLGTSSQETEQGAAVLAAARIPMINIIVTSDELNYQRTPGLFKVLPANQDQVAALKDYLQRHPAMKRGILVSDIQAARGDLFLHSILGDEIQQLGRWLTSNRLTYVGSLNPGPARPDTFTYDVQTVCSSTADFVVFAGRKNDAGHFLDTLVQAEPACNRRVTVLVAGTDLGGYRDRAQTYAKAGITVVYTAPDAPADWLSAHPTIPPPDQFASFRTAFDQNFAEADLADGEAMQAYDAVRVAGTAVTRSEPDSSRELPSSADVLTNLLNLNGRSAVQGATGVIGYQVRNNAADTGNPIGRRILVLSIPPSDEPVLSYLSK
jgi:ABC-type branched-subunit amino acid transport system substrate-binding protein